MSAVLQVCWIQTPSLSPLQWATWSHYNSIPYRRLFHKWAYCITKTMRESSLSASRAEKVSKSSLVNIGFTDYYIIFSLSNKIEAESLPVIWLNSSVVGRTPVWILVVLCSTVRSEVVSEGRHPLYTKVYLRSTTAFPRGSRIVCKQCESVKKARHWKGNERFDF